jgi:hypothetical protein
MDIEGTRDEMSFAMRTQWSTNGHPSSTVLEVRPTIPIDGRHHLHWSGGEPPASELDLAAILDGSVEIVIDQDAIRLSFGPKPASLDHAVAKLEAMIEIGSELSGHGGTYR